MSTAARTSSAARSQAASSRAWMVASGVAGLDRVADLEVHHDADRVVDRVLLAGPARAELASPRGRSRARRTRATEPAARRLDRAHAPARARARTRARRPGADRRPGPRSSARARAGPRRRRAPPRRGARPSASSTPRSESTSQPGGRGQDELAEVGRAVAGAASRRLGDLEGVADGVRRAARPCASARRPSGRPARSPSPRMQHAPARAPRRGAGEGPVADLHVEQDRVGAGGDLLRHHRGRDQRRARAPCRSRRAARRAPRPPARGSPVWATTAQPTRATWSTISAHAEPDAEARGSTRACRACRRCAPRPRPRHLGHRHAHAAASGASTIVVLSPTPPVECLSTTAPAERREVDRRRPSRIMRRDSSSVSASREPAEDDRHRTTRSSAPARRGRRRSPRRARRSRRRRVLGAVALALDELDRRGSRSIGVARQRRRSCARREPRGRGRADVREPPSWWPRRGAGPACGRAAARTRASGRSRAWSGRSRGPR